MKKLISLVLLMSTLSGCGCRVLLNNSGKAKAEETKATKKIVLNDLTGKEIKSWSGKDVLIYVNDGTTFIDIDSRQIAITKNFFVEVTEE